jgi:hypothetical protein
MESILAPTNNLQYGLIVLTWAATKYKGKSNTISFFLAALPETLVLSINTNQTPYAAAGHQANHINHGW